MILKPFYDETDYMIVLKLLDGQSVSEEDRKRVFTRQMFLRGLMTNWIPVVWEQEGKQDIKHPHVPVQIHRMESPFYYGIRYAVRNGNMCLSTDLEWDFEPSPSNREAEFYEKYRFKSFEDAIIACSKVIQ